MSKARGTADGRAQAVAMRANFGKKTSPTRRDMTTKALSSIECEPTKNRLCIRGRSWRRVSSEHFIVEISRLFAALHETLPSTHHTSPCGLEWEGATQPTVQASIRSANDRDAVLGSAELNLALPGSWALDIDWISDGSTPCRLELRVSIVSGAGRSTFKEMNFSRQWPLAQGAPRFREMSSLSR
jgi:hypothetical protein